MIITYFFTELGKSGGPLCHYQFMDGLVAKGHTVYVVTDTDAFRWHKDAHLEKLQVRSQVSPVTYIKGLYNGVRYRLGKLPVPTAAELIARHTKCLMQQYEALGISSDVMVATHTFTGEAVYRLGQGKSIVMHNMHFEELLFTDESDRLTLRSINYLPLHHITNCQWLERMFKNNYNLDSTVIPPGIDQKVFGREVTAEKYHTASRLRLLSYCDPTRAFKGYDQQLAILEQLVKKNNNFEIIFYGHDPKTDRFPYRYAGWVSPKELADLYADSHLLVSFSWYESFPLPPIEAMAAGCAVATSQYGTEDYLTDGITGVFIDPFDIKTSVQTLDRLLNDRDRLFSLAKAGKKKSIEFVWSKQIDQLHDCLANLSVPNHLDIAAIQQGKFEEFEKLNEQTKKS